MKQLFSPAADSSSGPWMRGYRHENCHMCDVYWWSWNQVQISQLLLTQLFHFFLLTRAVLKSVSRFVNPYTFRFRWLDVNKWRRWWWHDRSHHCKQGQSICNAFFDWWMLATEVWCSGTNCNAFFLTQYYNSYKMNTQPVYFCIFFHVLFFFLIYMKISSESLQNMLQVHHSRQYSWLISCRRDACGQTYLTKDCGGSTESGRKLRYLASCLIIPLHFIW